MKRGFQWDLARQTERLDWLLRQLPRYAEWGYEELYIHLEDAVEYPSLPGVARKDAYSRRDFARLVEAAHKAGIGVVPIVNLLGHTQYLIKVPELRDLNELRAPDGSPLPTGQVCPLHPRMLEVADTLMKDVEPFCTAGKIHVGLDESFSLGRHPLSREEISRIGLARHFAGHVQRLEGLARGRNLRMGLWADMLALLPGSIPHLPRGILAYDWFYYPFERLPRMEPRNFAEYDLAPSLRKHGIEYWGCPMNGAFRHEPLPLFGERLANIRDWWRRCQSVGAAGFLVTGWEPNRLAIELTTAVDAAAASLWLDTGRDDATAMLAAGLRRVFGKAGNLDLARSALACDSRAFVGNSRWEINARWDVCPSRRGTARLEGERSFYARLARRGASLPAPFRLSVEQRLYLAERDVYVRSAAAMILSLRRRLARHGATDAGMARGLGSLLANADLFAASIRSGRQAARRLWRLTRDPGVMGPNERIAEGDSLRLREFRRWIEHCIREPMHLETASPVCGSWQLWFDVIVLEPALQRVVVEGKGPDGAWSVLHARTLIEFRAQAARSRAKLRLEMSVPLPTPEAPLRISVRGLGRVGIARIELTNGVSAKHCTGWKPRETRFIGKPTPRRGFPILDWERNTGSLALRFS
jgi:hypothetical protein